MAAKKEVYISAESFILCPNIQGKKYYLYVHTRSDKNDIFYIGIGTLNNGKYDRAKSKKGRNNIWNKIVNKTNYKIFIYDESDSLNDILEKEIYYIKLLGKIKNKTGTLSNITDGGEGSKGCVLTKEHKEKISKSTALKNKGRVVTIETRKKLADLIKTRSFFGRKGEDSPLCRAVVKLDPITKELLEEFINVKLAGKSVGVTAQSIGNACRKGFISKGYIWKYKSDYNANK